MTHMTLADRRIRQSTNRYTRSRQTVTTGTMTPPTGRRRLGARARAGGIARCQCGGAGSPLSHPDSRISPSLPGGNQASS